MLDDIAGTYGSRLFVAAGGVAVALLVLVGVLWLIRNRAPSPFVRGGKGRQQRLQVLDAAAIDARRRIVLIRRDGVEHLVMIGGPTDIVIESGIGDLSKLSVAQPSIAAPTPLEAVTAGEPTRPTPQLESPPEPARLASRPPERPAQLAPSPVQAAIKAPEAAVTEPRPQQQPEPPRQASPAPIVAAEPSFAAAEPQAPQTSAPVMAPSAPVAAPPAPAARIEPTVFERQEEVEAASILDAARNRVLTPQPELPPEVMTASAPKTPNPFPPPPILVQDAYSETHDDPAPEIVPPRKPNSDFESILEAEMSNTLTAERAPQPTVQPPVQRPQPEPAAPQQRRDPEMAPITGGDAALQKEVARIFGEMSVNRDK